MSQTDLLTSVVELAEGPLRRCPLAVEVSHSHRVAADHPCLFHGFLSFNLQVGTLSGWRERHVERKYSSAPSIFVLFPIELRMLVCLSAILSGLEDRLGLTNSDFELHFFTANRLFRARPMLLLISLAVI